jgi:Xaa-Pro aminopeptidase
MPAPAGAALSTVAGAVDRAVFGPGATHEPPDLEAFRHMQQLAYRAAEQIAGELEPGVTERQAARRLRQLLEENQVTEWFHIPFAWFGDRTTLRFRALHQFLPTDRRLEEGMVYILDCAPSINGVASDIGYTGTLGANAIADEVVGCLAEHRTRILELARSRRPMRAVYHEVDRLAARQGLDPRHHAYPGRVLAHRIDPLDPDGHRPVVGTFGLRYLHDLAEGVRRGRRDGTTPLWADGRGTDHPAPPGLWAVEPHLSLRGVGAKFEELLVVTDDDAWWLDDDLPHVRRWAATPAEVSA